MIVESLHSTPHFIFPTDAIHLPPGRGFFTCCARNHESGPCEIHALSPVLAGMIGDKINYLWDCDRVFDARIFTALKRWLMRGLPMGEAPSGLDAARTQFRWRGEEQEAAETRQTGVGIVFWCAISDNGNAMRELAAAARDGGRNESEKMRIDRSDLFGWFQKGMTPLHMAASFASWPVVSTLLDMGYDATAKSTDAGFDSLTLACITGRAETVQKWCARFPGRQKLTRRATPAGFTALAGACAFGPDKLETVKAVVAAGADPSVCTALTGTTVLHNVASNRDANEELVRYLLGLPGVQELVDTKMCGKTVKWKAQFKIAGLLVKRLGSKKAILKNVSEWNGNSAVAAAARNGNSAAVRVLVSEGHADTSLQNAMGQSALDQLVGGEDALEEVRELLRVP